MSEPKAENFTDSQLSNMLDSEWLKIFLQVLLLLGFLELIVGRVFMHAPQLSTVLLPFTSIVMNFEAVIEVPILVLFVYIFWKNKNSLATTALFGFSSILLVATVLLYILSLAGVGFYEILWLIFLFVSIATIFAASAKRILTEMRKRGTSSFLFVVFLALANLTYFLVYAYFISFNLPTYFGVKVPGPVVLFGFAQSLVVVDALLLFSYAASVSWRNLRFSKRLLLNVFLLPSLIVTLLIIALVMMPTGSSFDMAEIIALVLSMWGFAVPRAQVLLYIIMFWFFLVATLLLREEAGKSKGSIYMLEFTAAFLIFFAGFLNPLPYLLMSVIAVILFSSKTV